MISQNTGLLKINLGELLEGMNYQEPRVHVNTIYSWYFHFSSYPLFFTSPPLKVFASSLVLPHQESCLFPVYLYCLSQALLENVLKIFSVQSKSSNSQVSLFPWLLYFLVPPFKDTAFQGIHCMMLKEGGRNVEAKLRIIVFNILTLRFVCLVLTFVCLEILELYPVDNREPLEFF